MASMLVLQVVTPVLKDWLSILVAAGGDKVIFLLLGVGVAGWAWGRTQLEAFMHNAGYGGRRDSEPGSGPGQNVPRPPPHGDPSGHAHGYAHPGAGPGPGPGVGGGAGTGTGTGTGTGAQVPGADGPRPKPTWQRANTGPTMNGTPRAGATRSGWDRAREETRKKEEERKRKEEAEKKAKEAAWERARAREREARERQEREKQERDRQERERQERERREAAEREEREKREAAERQERLKREAADRAEKERHEAERHEATRQERERREAAEKRERERRLARDKEARERREREERDKKRASSSSSSTTQAPPRPPLSSMSSSAKKHQQPTARTYVGTEAEEHSFRPYDRPKPKRPAHKTTTSRSSVYSEASSSYAASQSTARTTPPPPGSNRGPYSTADPDKIVIKAVYQFSNTFAKLPMTQLVSGVGSVTDGLILRITTEGLFIDDDVRNVPQREWDVKAWTMKLVENGDYRGLHLLRATIRDQDGRRFVFVLSEAEGWKVAIGLQRLRKGSQVRALGVSSITTQETRAVLENLGWGG